jgi:PAS domain S-box-containing protein
MDDSSPGAGAPLASPAGFPRDDRLSSAALIVTDASGHVVLWNRQAEWLYGWTRAEAIGTHILELSVHVADAAVAEEILARVTAGELWEGSFAAMRKGGTNVEVLVRDTPLVDRDGTVIGVLGESLPVGVEVLEQVAATTGAGSADGARERLAFLAQVTGVLDESLDHVRVIRRLAQLCVPFLGDNCLVDVTDEDGELQEVAVSASDPAKAKVLAELRRRYPPTATRPNPAVRVATTGRSELFVDMPDSMWRAIAQDDAHFELLRSLGLRSGITAPLMVRGRVRGAISVGSIESGRRFDASDLAFLEEVGRRAGVAIDNARLYTELADVARNLQASLLPPALPVLPGAEIAARYLAAGGFQVGGDFYDVFQTADGAWAALVGDVEGKGTRAAGLTGLARHTLRGAALHERSPSAVLQDLNTVLIDSPNVTSFCTVALVRLERRSGGFAVSAAAGGHPKPFLLRADGTLEQIEATGHLLGFFPTIACYDVHLVLDPGDTIVLYTDGVTERRAGVDFFGEDGLGAVLADHRGEGAQALAEAVVDRVSAFHSDAPTDDMAVLVIQAT